MIQKNLYKVVEIDGWRYGIDAAGTAQVLTQTGTVKTQLGDWPLLIRSDAGQWHVGRRVVGHKIANVLEREYQALVS